ncbi:hypothetical protein D3C80_1332790 [compost metagenome]
MLLQLVAVAVQIILIEPELPGQQIAQAVGKRRALGRAARFIERIRLCLQPFIERTVSDVAESQISQQQAGA